VGGVEGGQWQVGELVQTMYTQMNKCKNNKKRKKVTPKNKLNLRSERPVQLKL
jgi:hypothetical protein